MKATGRRATKIIKKAKFWYWNYAAIFFLFFSKISIKAQAQGQVISVPAKIDINSSLQGSVGGIMINNKKTVTGKITNTDGTPVSFATIKIKGTNQASGADADGIAEPTWANYRVVKHEAHNFL